MRMHVNTNDSCVWPRRLQLEMRQIKVEEIKTEEAQLNLISL